MTTPTKHCRRCDTVRPVSDFWRSSGTKDGLFAYCKGCARAYIKLRHINNPEACARDYAANTRWRRQHPEKVREYNLRNNAARKLRREQAQSKGGN